MCKLFRVRIIKSFGLNAWYNEKVGAEIIVYEWDSFNYCCVDDRYHVISKQDVEIVCEVVAETIYVDVKPKVKKYLVLYRATQSVGETRYYVTQTRYANKEDFYVDRCYSSGAHFEFLQFIESSMIEE